MTNSLPNRKSTVPARSARPSWGLLLVLLLIIFAGTSFFESFNTVAVTLGSPFIRSGQGVANIWLAVSGSWADKQVLLAENQNLKSKAAELVLAQDRLRALENENNHLRASLGRKNLNTTALATARILITPRLRPFDLLTLDLGTENSLVPFAAGDLVTVGDDLLLGHLVSLSGSTSRVQLLSLAGIQTTAVLGEDRTPLVLEGRGGGNFRATLPRGITVSLGDRAIVSTPARDWLVATVGAVENENNETEQTIYLRVPLNLSKLVYVDIRPR